MRTVDCRKKKLIVAFHFHFARQAQWKCDECRRLGLERARGCGFGDFPKPARPVWVRRATATYECPRSLITPDSARWLEEFLVWKVSGGADLTDRPARTADAFFVLDREWRKEMQHGNDSAFV